MKSMAIILAAGEGKRMKSDLPKVLHEAAGQSLLAWVGAAARESGVDQVVTVIGNGAERVREAFAGDGWEFAVQHERRGTGDAVRAAASFLEDFDGEVLVLAGDTPLLRGATLATLRQEHRRAQAAVTVLTACLPDPTGYGRILRDDSGAFTGIIEHRDASEAQRAVDEVNSSVYCFEADALRSALSRIRNDNDQGEYYLTDAVEILRGDGLTAIAISAATPEEILGVNDRDQLAEVERLLIAERNGV